MLLTGFEPFGGQTRNPSAELVNRLVGSLAGVRTAVLPVDADRAPAQLTRLLLEQCPDWCVMLGQAGGRAALSVERVAVNYCHFRIADNAGQQLVDQPVVAGGPAAYFTTLPVPKLLAAAQRVGVPAEQSLSAGAYLCNMLFYTALHMAAEYNLPTRCGFVHVPLLPEQPNSRAIRPVMKLDAMALGVGAMLNVLVAYSAQAAVRVAAD